MERIIWLSFQVEPDGTVRTRVTLERDGEIVRERREAASLEEAQETFGGSFREVVQRVLESGSRRGRWRP